MIYPEFIKKGDYIGITAPSDGVTNEKKIYRLDNAISKLSNLDFPVIETDNVRTSILGRSADKIKRAKQLEELYKNDDVKAIICATGGDFLIEMVPYLDLDVVSKNPKWLQGYSDPTSLLFTITTNLDIATIYGYNAGAFGMSKWHSSVENSLEILKGNIVEQNSFDKYEGTYGEYIVGDEPFVLDEEVKWQNIYDDKSARFEGRLIGGCLDVLVRLIGTKFDKTKEFIQKYKQDGIIWYFDNFGLNSEGIITAMWQLKNGGWFEHTKGIIFGRSVVEGSEYGTSFKEAVETSLGDLNIPVIIDADVGHKLPQIIIINGAYGIVDYADGKGSVKMLLK